MNSRYVRHGSLSRFKYICKYLNRRIFASNTIVIFTWKLRYGKLTDPRYLWFNRKIKIIFKNDAIRRQSRIERNLNGIYQRRCIILRKKYLSTRYRHFTHRRFICIKIRQIPTDNVSSDDFDPRFLTDKSLRHERRWRISPQKYLSSSITGRIYARSRHRGSSSSGCAEIGQRASKKFWDHPVDIHRYT